MDQNVMREYNNFIINGGDQGRVLDEHAMYHKRLFGEEIFNNQIEFIINTLRRNKFAKRAQANLWFDQIDQIAGFTPCLQIIWARIMNGKLELHAHMRANDGYKKALMNMNIFTEIQRHIAKELGVKPGRYVQFVDSYHFYAVDKEKIEDLYKKINR
jgi:thymidylate synthase